MTQLDLQQRLEQAKEELAHQISVNRILCENANRREREFDALQQQVNALAAENLLLRQAIETHKQGFTVCECCGEENISAIDDVCRVLAETPTTDTIKRQWMAKGDNDTWQTLIALAKLNNDLYRWTSRMSYNRSWVGEPEGLIKGHIREMEKILDAAQLRQPEEK